MVFRDDNVVVIEVGSLLTRAIVGLDESMTPPQVRVHTRIGIQRKGDEGKATAEYLFGDELDEAVAKNDVGVQVIYPVAQGRIADWDAVEIFWYLPVIFGEEEAYVRQAMVVVHKAGPQVSPDPCECSVACYACRFSSSLPFRQRTNNTHVF